MNTDPSTACGLRSLPAVGSELKLIYGLRALQPLAEHGPAAITAALTLVTEILSALGTFLSRNPDTTLADLRAAAVSTLLDLRPGHEPVPEADVEHFRSPQVVLLEAAEMAQLRRAGSAGKSEEIVHGAAGMVHELWVFADELQRTPAGRAGELIHVRCWGSPATTKILRKLTLGAAVTAVVPDGGLMRGFRPPGAHSGQKNAWHQSERTRASRTVLQHRAVRCRARTRRLTHAQSQHPQQSQNLTDLTHR